MNLNNINRDNSDLFDQCWKLYETSFPIHERRSLEYHLQTMERERFRFDAIFDDDLLVGIICWWNFENLYFIEHFAIFDNLRSGGYGGRVLDLFCDKIDKKVLLEVEYPEDELSKRRIKFYERKGFVLNAHLYSHPPYMGVERVSLKVMTYPSGISQMELTNFMDDYFPIIHFKD